MGKIEDAMCKGDHNNPKRRPKTKYPLLQGMLRRPLRIAYDAELTAADAAAAKGESEVAFRHSTRWSVGSGSHFGMNLICCPPSDASAIAPPSGRTKTATPSTNDALAPAPEVAMIALAFAPKFISPFLKRSIAALFSKTISSLDACPPT